MVSSSLLEIPSDSDLQLIDESDAAGGVRVAVPYKPKMSRFNKAAQSVSGINPSAKVTQYNFIYSCRLDQLRAVVVEAGVLCLLLKLKETAACYYFRYSVTFCKQENYQIFSVLLYIWLI